MLRPIARTKWTISPLLIQIPVSIAAGFRPVLRPLYQRVDMIATFAIIAGNPQKLWALLMQPQTTAVRHRLFLGVEEHYRSKMMFLSAASISV